MNPEMCRFQSLYPPYLAISIWAKVTRPTVKAHSPAGYHHRSTNSGIRARRRKHGIADLRCSLNWSLKVQYCNVIVVLLRYVGGMDCARSNAHFYATASP